MSIKNWPGGRISKTPPTPAGPYQDGAASGVWTLDQVAFWQKQGLWPIAGNAQPNFIEDVFSTYLYTGTGATQTITNGIDLSGKGGLVWIKGRSGATGHRLTDTARGATKSLESNSSAAAVTESTGLTAFNGTGFSIGADADYNTNTATYVSWAFREQAKFFDVVTYTGNGVAGRTVPHNLGSVPGCIIVKDTGAGNDWLVYHRGAGNTKFLVLNSVDAAGTSADWANTDPTSTHFSVGSRVFNNANGGTYVAYLFAHDAGGFGLAGTDNVISCGSYTGNGGTITVNLGYEPQWVMIKNASAAADWNMIDVMRGWDVASANDQRLQANSSGAESILNAGNPTATGFEITSAGSGVNASGNTYIYIAIRRGPMKVPTSGTSVFTPVTRTGTGANTTTTAGFPVDMGMTAHRTPSNVTKWPVVDRLRGAPYLITSGSGAELTDSTLYQTNPFDSQDGLKLGTTSSMTNASGSPYIDYLLRRAPGFFDVVAYTGTGTNRTVNHNLAAVPEMMIVKRRDVAADWWVYDAATGNTKYQVLNSTATPVTSATAWNNTTPTGTVFTVGTGTPVNASAGTYVAYLFASAPGVSKVGSYTGNGTSQTINCGFTGGARFVLIKRTDSTGDWYVWDSARGIVAGDDPHLSLNSVANEVTTDDSVDSDSTGFIVNQVAATNINVSAATYIFLAIA